MFALPVASIRELENRYREKHGNCFELMLRAGTATADFINSHSSGFKRVLFLCGKGNNAGDAICAAAQVNLPHLICLTNFAGNFSGEAAQALHRYRDKLDIEVDVDDPAKFFQPGDLLVDALLGIGYDGGELKSRVGTWIKAINKSRLPVLSLDVPSGLNADNGKIFAPDSVVNATWTLSFGAPKRGFFLASGAECRGELAVADIGLGEPEKSDLEGAIPVYTIADAALDLPACGALTHKKSRGIVAVFAGSRQYPGAAALAFDGAMRSGAGLARLFSEVRPANLPNCAIYRELDHENAASWQGLLPEISESDVILAGPGWGSEVPVEFLQLILAQKSKIILDADALNLLARHPGVWKNSIENVIMTPHPGEAKRLAEAFEVAISPDRSEFALALAKKLNAVIVLKGRDSVIASPDDRYAVNSSGDCRLATAGSGDVLSGIISGIFCRKSDPFASAALGVFLHGLAGEKCSGFPIADDLASLLPECFRDVARHGVF